MTDQELLRDYARHGSESAFAELVRRHVDLVYSAAVRIARNGTAAQDITQNVFIALARSAKHLTNRPVLAGWLHQTTRNIAANTIRSALRRSVYEQEAATMNELLTSPNENSWEDIAPQIDEALAALADSDRNAILLRYFQRKTAHEMALTLEISDEAAQKRVNRAVERLRESFSKRNLHIGAAGLALMISANAVQSAPADFAVSLAASVTTSAAAVQSGTAIAAGKVLAHSTLAKALLAATLVAAAGTGLYEARRMTLARNPNLVALADAGLASTAALQPQPNHLATTPNMGAPQSKIIQWTGRKRAHEPTLAEAEEDLTNALVQLGLDADRTPDVWVQRGELQARTGRWNEAVTNLRQALVVDPADAWAGYLLSSALLASGDLAEYQKHSHAMMVTFGHTDNPIVAGRTSEAYLVAPYGDTTDLEMSVALLENKRFYWWREFYEGLAQYRLGNFSAAAGFLEKDITKLPSINQIDRPPCEADCYLVLAMARRQLNQPAEAATALAHARQAVETQMPQPGAPDLGPYWWNGVTTRALLKEASETVEQWTATPANASFTFSLARTAANAAHNAKSVIPLSGPYSEPPAGPLRIVPESVIVNNGQMQFTIAGITSGATVCVLASDELFTPSSWTPISTNIVTSSTLTVGAIPATNAHKFFRILETR
jgi:RNA polymerase sigma factor (sigma-70 family)